MAYPAPLKDQIITLRTEILKLLQAHHDTIFLRFLQATSPDGTPLSGEGPRASSISAKIVAQLTRSLYGHSRETSAHPPMQPEPWPLWAVEIDILDREMDAIENEMEAVIKGIENLQRGGRWGSYEICKDAEDRLSALWFRSK